MVRGSFSAARLVATRPCPWHASLCFAEAMQWGVVSPLRPRKASWRLVERRRSKKSSPWPHHWSVPVPSEAGYGVQVERRARACHGELAFVIVQSQRKVPIRIQNRKQKQRSLSGTISFAVFCSFRTISIEAVLYLREPPVLGTPPNLSDQNLEVRGEDFPRNRIFLVN